MKKIMPAPALSRLSLSSIKLKLALLFFAISISIPAFSISSSAIQNLPDFNELVEQSGPAVVNIRVTQKVSAKGEGPQLSPEEQELFERYFGQPNPHSEKQPGEK